MIKFDLELIEQTPLNDNTVNMSFNVLSDETLDVQAGQFLRLHFDQDGKETFRSYSIATIFDQENMTMDKLSIAVSWVKGGLATEYLSAMQPGEKIAVSGPFGRFCLPENNFKRYFLIATGTGVTPYRAMLNEIKNRLDAGSEFYVVMGAQDESGLLYEADFLELVKKYDGFHYVACLSRKQRNENNENDCEGHVQNFLKEMQFDAETDISYLCGNPNMVDEAFALLKEKGLPVQQIKREKYISPIVRKK